MWGGGLTSRNTTAAARKRFDQAMASFDDRPAGRLSARFREATEIDPSMADAWLGRIAAGDEALSTLQQLYAYGARLHRETNRLGVRLSAPIKAGPYLAISVTESSHAGLALASALIDDGQYEKAEALLTDSALLDTWENHQWHQYAGLPDVRHPALAGRDLGGGDHLAAAGDHHVGGYRGHQRAGRARRGPSRASAVSRWTGRTGSNLRAGQAGRGPPPPADRHRGDGDRSQRIPLDRSRSGLCAGNGASPARRRAQSADLAVEGDDQRCADRTGQGGAGRSATATGGHRRGNHQHPHQQVGRQHRAVRSSSAAKRKTKSGAKSCWPKAAPCSTTRSG